ncbi:MAG: mechanosensitive ion channel [Muribaculaceae bacterium]|nr:mechanosensitive ion channel [Muribaculaceae bacterium]
MIQTQDIFPVKITDADSIPVADIPQLDFKQLASLSWSEVADNVVDGLINFALHLAVAIIVFLVGRFIIRRITVGLKAVMLRKTVDRSLATFILSLVKIILMFTLIVIVIGILGVNTSSFIALFASAGIAIGMALSGTLQNFAGGVLILLLKPYKVGDYIETQGYEGYVTEIQIFHTLISTYDNKSIIVPNGPISSGSINNYSREKYRLIERKISLPYGVDMDFARKEILKILAADSRLISVGDLDDNTSTEAETTPAADTEKKQCFLKRFFRRHRAKYEELASEPLAISVIPRVSHHAAVALNALDNSSLDVRVRAWTEGKNYWPVYYEILERIYTELPKVGINFPFPQLDVHFDKSKK